MTRAAWAWAAAAGVTLAAGVGCYSPPPNYGYQTYPTAPGAYPVAPDGSYVVPGTGMPGTLGPGTTYPGGSGPTLAPPIGGGDAPPATYEGGAVPSYEDPSAGDYEPGNGFGTPPNDGFEPPTTDGGSPFYQDSTAAPRPLPIEQAARPMDDSPDYLAGLDEYGVGGPSAATSETAEAGSDVRQATFEESDPGADFGFDPTADPDSAGSAKEGDFAYDRAGYAWLQGVIDYDPRQNNWHIIYGLAPTPADKFGGSLTLVDGQGELAEFRENDVVLVQGRVDPQAGSDRLGKPLYRVTNAELIGRFE